MNKPVVLLSVLLLSAPVLAQGTAAAVPESAASRLAGNKIDKTQLSSNLDSVGKLLESSSAARQIESSKAQEALQRRDRARELYRAAKAELDQGNLEKASALLAETRSTFFDAVRFAAPEEVTAKKVENDYLLRLESVQALLGAYKRVSGEKSAKGVSETVAQIEKSIAAGAVLAKERKFTEARAEIDRGYLVAKAGLTSLRSGDTLTRSLNFASKEEEYQYEIDRNNTHQMLIKVLVDDQKASGDMVKNFLSKAAEFRLKADAAASRKDYAEAIKLLEESTAELVRAIRNAGIYIPG
jgi:biopolymer transport protein ExbD